MKLSDKNAITINARNLQYYFKKICVDINNLKTTENDPIIKKTFETVNNFNECLESLISYVYEIDIDIEDKFNLLQNKLEEQKYDYSNDSLG